MAAYLVTGGCGFIGSHLCDALVQRGHSVGILDDLSSGAVANAPSQAQIIRADVADLSAVESAMSGVDGCFHLAAVASVERSTRDWLGAHRVNLTGTITVFEAARRHSGQVPLPVVFASSAAVYGHNTNLPLSETAATNPLSGYGADKLGCEAHARVATRVHGIPTIGLRFFNVYGPRQDPKSPYFGVISLFCERIRKAQPITIFGDGKQTRDFVYVGDVVTALMQSMHQNNKNAGEPALFNVCTGTPISVLHLAYLIGELCGVEPQLRFEPQRVGEIRHSVGDAASARRGLGFTAASDLKSGLLATLDWMAQIEHAAD